MATQMVLLCRLALFDLLPTEQLHVVDLRGRHSLFDGALNHDVAGSTLLQKSGLLCGCEGQKDGSQFLGLTTEILQTDACRANRRHVGRVIRTVGRDAEVAGLRPGRAPRFLEPPPVVAGAVGGETLGLLVFPVGRRAAALVVVGIGTVEADQGVGVLVCVVLLVGRGPDRRKDEPVVVVGDPKGDPETVEVEVEGAQCIAVSCVERL